MMAYIDRHFMLILIDIFSDTLVGVTRNMLQYEQSSSNKIHFARFAVTRQKNGFSQNIRRKILGVRSSFFQDSVFRAKKNTQIGHFVRERPFRVKGQKCADKFAIYGILWSKTCPE